MKLVWDQQRRDRHQRLLAYVYLPDGRMLNQRLISQGWARAFRKFNYRHKENFLRLQKSARAEKRGLWQEPGGP